MACDPVAVAVLAQRLATVVVAAVDDVWPQIRVRHVQAVIDHGHTDAIAIETAVPGGFHVQILAGLDARVTLAFDAAQVLQVPLLGLERIGPGPDLGLPLRTIVFQRAS